MNSSNGNGSQSSRAASRKSSIKVSNQDEGLPDINSARSKNSSRGPARIMASTPQSASKSGLKSFQLAEQFQADQIIDKQRSETNVSGPQKSLDGIEVINPMKKKSGMLQVEPVPQKIDFHRLNDKSELSQRSNVSKKSARSVRSRRASTAKAPQKVEKP